MAFVVRGRADTKTVHPRLEIRDLYNLKDPKISKQWTLFISSYLAIQKPDEPILFKTSSSFTVESLLPPGGDFFSIGAIHGLPYERWPGDPASDRIVPEKKPDDEVDVTAADIKPVHVFADEHDHLKGADDEPVKPGDENFRYGGYCNHGSILFPPWHRPYLLAIEESIGRLATAIAKEIGSLAPDEAKEWEEAAACLRFPFWDWTYSSTGDEDIVPSAILDETVKIIGPGGEEMSVPNPIHSFELEKYIKTDRCRQFADVKVDIPWSSPNNVPAKTQMGYYRTWHRTVRWPVDSMVAQDQPAKLQSIMTARFAELRTKVAHLFSLEDPRVISEKDWPHQWDKFSNTTVESDGKVKPKPPNWSLEAPHNWMHLILGGMGHMGQNEFAGFDPVFYLHHANVDRLYALWEWVYPEYRPRYGWHDKETDQTAHFMQPGGTFTQLPASRLDQWTDMLPWRNAAGSYWTMDDVSWENRKKWPNFYTYPIVADIDVNVPAPDNKTRMAARARLQAHFQLGAKESLKVVEKNKGSVFQTPAGMIPRRGVFTKYELTELDNYRHFVIAVELSEHVFNDSYFLELLYPAGPHGGVWRGHAAVLTRPVDSPCENCQRRRAAGIKVKDMINIPAEHVAAILDALPKKVPTTQYPGTEGEDTTRTEVEEIFILKKFMEGRLIGRDGTVYAHTVPPGDEIAENALLPADLAPKLRFMTAYAGVKKGVDDADAPVELYGWKDFDDVFEGARWKMGPAPQTSDRDGVPVQI